MRRHAKSGFATIADLIPGDRRVLDERPELQAQVFVPSEKGARTIRIDRVPVPGRLQGMKCCPDEALPTESVGLGRTTAALEGDSWEMTPCGYHSR